MKFVFIVLLLLTINDPRAVIQVQPQTAIVRPDDSRAVTITVDALRPITMLVVLVPLRSPVTTDDPACQSLGDHDWTQCRYFGIAASEQLTLTLKMQPIHIITTVISDACAERMSVGTPLSIAIDGQFVMENQIVWSEYQPGYCAFLPVMGQP